MQIFFKKSELADFIENIKRQGGKIGFVPTMGALHQGHLSLIQFSKNQCDVTLASIFVNPTQFNDASDLRNYPRNLPEDLQKLEKLGCDAVFVPDENEMYPEKDTRVFDFDGIDAVMEGQHRPGHFNGVAQIVSKLFDLVKPDLSYFGQKDFQQVAIIKKMVRKLKMAVTIVACPIVREPDGLAMSSRNLLLTPQHRALAPLIYQTLTEAVVKSKTESINEVKKWVTETINKSGYLKVEYFDIVNGENLMQVDKIQPNVNNIGCIAVWAGNVRLIDNINFNL